MKRERVFVAGATGYIGRFVVRELVRRGYQVVCLARERSGVGAASDRRQTQLKLAGAEVRFGDVCEADSLRREGFRGEAFDYLVSCLGSRSGAQRDAWLVEHQANLNLLEAARDAGVRHFVLLSAICVQKPELAFQRAKLAFEASLEASGIDFSIVRPTAFFKSLAGQVEAVKRGKPFVVFSRGDLTRCKPISESDLATYMADCLIQPGRRNRILPVGGPGEALTPREQGEMLFTLCGRQPRFRQVPLGLFNTIIAALDGLSAVFPSLADKAEFARIGRYYASESMLCLDPESGEYDANATPSVGQDTLEAFYGRVLAEGMEGQELGDHALFS